MTDKIRRKLSIAFTIYNKAIAQARRAGDVQAVENWNKTLGRLVKDAYRRHNAAPKSTAFSIALG